MMEPDMTNFLDLAKLPPLIEGAGGGDPRAGLCVMEMADYIAGSNQVSDRPACACPVITPWAIFVNDTAPSQADRDSLRELIIPLTGTKDSDAEQARAEHLVRRVAHALVAPLLSRRCAAALRAAQTMADIEKAAGRVRDKSKSECAARLANGVALVISGDVTDGLDNVVFVAAHCSTLDNWPTKRAILVELIYLGKHGVPDPLFKRRADELAALLAPKLEERA